MHFFSYEGLQKDGDCQVEVIETVRIGQCRTNRQIPNLECEAVYTHHPLKVQDPQDVHKVSIFTESCCTL